MYELREEEIYCPYCGEPLTVLIDESEGEHEYVEDCQVCCRPIEFQLVTNDLGELAVRVGSDNDFL